MDTRGHEARNDVIATEYDQYYQKPIHLEEDRVVAGFIRDRVLEEDSILELGCGTGWLLDNVEIDPAKYVGTDLSHTMLRMAREKHPEHYFMRVDLADPPPDIDRREFDMAVSTFGPLSYLTVNAATRAVEWTRRQLTDGGLAVLMFFGELFADHEDLSDPVKRQSYTRFQLQLMFQRWKDLEILGLTSNLAYTIPEALGGEFDLFSSVGSVPFTHYIVVAENA